MNEYVIFNANCTAWAVICQGGVQFVSLTSKPSVFKSKARAEAQAKKVGGAVDVYYGCSIISGSKGSVVAKQSDRNRKTPYRSI